MFTAESRASSDAQNAYWPNGRDGSDFLLGLWSLDIPWDEHVLDWLKENKIGILDLDY